MTILPSEEPDKLEMAKAYCSNKNICQRSFSGTPHIQVIDATTSTTSGNYNFSYTVQNHAGTEIWQSTFQEGDEFEEKPFLVALQEIVADIKIRAPKVLFTEFDVHPCASPKLIEALKRHGYQSSPGHESVIVTGEIKVLSTSLGSSSSSKQLSVLRLSQPQHGRDFGRACVEAYGLEGTPWGDQLIDCAECWATRERDSPQYLYFVGYYTTETNSKDPAVCLALCLAAGIVGIHLAGTRPKYQRKGLFHELLSTVLQEHLPKYNGDQNYTHYAASARSTTAVFFQKHGAIAAATKSKYLIG